MECATCGGQTNYLEPNGSWWCNRCLAATEGPKPSVSAEQPSLVHDVAVSAGTNLPDILAWIVGGLLIVAGVALLLAGWTKTGWTLAGFGALIGIGGVII